MDDYSRTLDDKDELFRSLLSGSLADELADYAGQNSDIFSDVDRTHNNIIDVLLHTASRHVGASGAARSVSRMLAEYAKRAYPYFVRAPICSLITEVSKTLPDTVVTADLLLTEHGVVHFGAPISLAMLPDMDITNLMWCSSRDDKGDMLLAILLFSRYAGRLVNVISTSVSSGYKFSQSGREDSDSTQSQSWILSLFLFLHQRLVVVAHRSPDRATRRRLDKKDTELSNSTIGVIDLRRYQHIVDAITRGDPVEWSCQWLVRGHWRVQHYKDSSRPIWIAPFIKGPADKPLKNPGKIFDAKR